MFLSTYLGLKVPADLVFATSTPLTVAFPALIIKLFRRVPFIFEVRDLWPDVPVELGLIKNKSLIFLIKAFERFAYSYSDRIICISEGIRERIPAPDFKKFHIPTGCDLQLFNGGKHSTWKEEMGIRSRSLFVFTGAIGEANAPQYLIEAAKILKEKSIHDIAVALVGDGSAREKVVRMKEVYGLDNVFIFDPVQKKDMPRILAAADGGIILHGLSRTYRETAAPNKFYDYIAAGLPIIFNFEGPLKKLILENKSGYYVDHHLPEQLSDILIHLSKKRKEAFRAGKNARRLANEKFDQKQIAIQFGDVLEECFFT